MADLLTHSQSIQTNPAWIELGYQARFQNFQNLMHHRVRDILLVSSLYDFFIFEEDGRLHEMILDKYQGLNLTHAPELTHVSSGHEAMKAIEESKRFELVVITLHIEDMSPVSFAKLLRASNADIPIVMLAFDNKELADILIHHETHYFDQIYIWQGDYRLILAMIKTIEDRMNVAHDTDSLGVQSIIVIEDNILYYSSLLPIIYVEVMRHSQRLIDEGVNLSHRRLRMRARPKILLCTTYEEAWTYFEKYQETVLGVISDIDFPRNGEPCSTAGLDFAKAVKEAHSDISILLHSTNQKMRRRAEALGASFVMKDSPTLLQELQAFMKEQLSFGDFVFYTEDGREVGRAHDLLSLEETLAQVPDESIVYHAVRNHFSNWLKARTEFWLAHEIRRQHISDFPTVEGTRQNLIRTLREYRHMRQRGIITDFGPETFDPNETISRIGGGSIGGKARGMSFVNGLISLYNVESQFQGIRIAIPPAIILGTDVFDDFMDSNYLRDFALNEEDDDAILERFLETKKFPEEVMSQLARFLDLVDTPLSVRSSSLLEDSHVHPFAGVYRTYMLPNVHSDPFVRLLELVNTIKKVFASTFYQSAKRYIKATPYRLEEEKMAVVIQKITGSRRNSRFYPSFSGVAKSYNYYPVPPQQFHDGIIQVALGLGKTVVEGGISVRFCPKYPKHIPQFSTVQMTIKDSQHQFYALDLKATDEAFNAKQDDFLKLYDLNVAEKDGMLSMVASTYSRENDRIYEGIGRDGQRLITFTPILNSKVFPLSEILEILLKLGSWGMGTPVEIEFAVQISEDKKTPHEFSVLQMRPIVLNRELEVLNIDQYGPDELVCQSDFILGHGILDDICDVVVVDREKFDRARSLDVAREVNAFNQKLLKTSKPYLLIGVGRWGSLDPWLGIPVTWDQISGARVIVEADFKDLAVEPSQGSHFFQNLNSFQIGYFTVNSSNPAHFLDWEWLSAQTPVEEKEFTRHLRFENPIMIKLSAHQKKGVILKPKT